MASRLRRSVRDDGEAARTNGVDAVHTWFEKRRCVNSGIRRTAEPRSDRRVGSGTRRLELSAITTPYALNTDTKKYEPSTAIT